MEYVCNTPTERPRGICLMIVYHKFRSIEYKPHLKKFSCDKLVQENTPSLLELLHILYDHKKIFIS